MLLEDMILKKMIKYMGITAATLLAVAPVAMPVISSATETTVKADTANQSDVQKWLSQVKSNVTANKNVLITQRDKELYYGMGTDNIWSISPQDLTPDTSFYDATDAKDDFFSHFNDNADQSNLFFNNSHYQVIMNATVSDGSISGNLNPNGVNQILQSGKTVTFHTHLRYMAQSDPTGNDFLKDYVENKGASTELAKKDVVVTLGNGANDSNIQNNQKPENAVPGKYYVSTFSPSVNAKLYDDNGKVTSASALSKASAWKVDREMSVNGTTYYRVANNEWVSGNDGIEVFPDVRTITTRRQAKLYTSAGKQITGRSLASNTAWYTDRVAIINNVHMHRVASDEWVSFDDLKVSDGPVFGGR